MSDELKPCPWCGKPGKLVQVSRHWIAACEDDRCADGPSGYGRGGPIKSWNTRPVEDALRAQVEQLTAERNALKQEIEIYRPLCILSDPALLEMYDNRQLPDREEIRVRVVMALDTRNRLHQAGEEILQAKANLVEARADANRLVKAVTLLLEAGGEDEADDLLEDLSPVYRAAVTFARAALEAHEGGDPCPQK